MKYVKFPVKIKDKNESKNSIAVSVLVVKIRKNIRPTYERNVVKKKHTDLFSTGEEGRRHYALIKDFSTFIYDHTLHSGRKHFCRYCLQALSTEEID